MIAIGSDHGGYALKLKVMEFLEAEKYEVKDFGICSEHSVDYPDIALPVAQAIINNECEKGILICGTGLGISIAANKVRGIRAAVCTDSYMARMSREHNNANILALGGRVVGVDLALDIVHTWLKSEFKGGRHLTRVNKICEIEKNFLK